MNDDTTIIETTALAVLQAEMLYTDAVALRAPQGEIDGKLADLEAAQQDYEDAILDRSTPTGQLSPPLAP